MTAELVVIRGSAELILRGPQLLSPIFEMLLAVLALRCRQLAEPAVQVVEVRLPRPAPRDARPWQRVFGVKPQFGADHAAFSLPAAMLERRLRTFDPAVRDALGTDASPSIKDQVAAHVRAWVRETPDAEQVARALGLSRRTLQRRLADEDVSFRDIVLGAKVDVARQLLGREHLSIAEIAEAVGFSRVAAFSRAFTKHAGVAPSKFRERALRTTAKR
jgi:AraC-like DNA-binding protein